MDQDKDASCSEVNYTLLVFCKKKIVVIFGGFFTLLVQIPGLWIETACLASYPV